MLLLLFASNTSFAGNFTRAGTTNTDWSTANNWSGNISDTPSTNDAVIILTGSNNVLLAGNVTVKKSPGLQANWIVMDTPLQFLPLRLSTVELLTTERSPVRVLQH